MSSWVWAPWLPWALLLIHVPGCLSLRGPRKVDGTVGGSLSVQCTYEQEYQNDSKYWCTYPCRKPMRKIVETSETQREARTGRTTIRDEPANLTFTVTLENLTEADKGRYSCGVSRPKYNLDLQEMVLVFVSPAPKPNPHMYNNTWTTERTSVLSTTTPSTGSLLSSVHFLLLIFLKVPLLLGMMGAVLWMSWPRRGPVTGRQRRVTTRGPV